MPNVLAKKFYCRPPQRMARHNGIDVTTKAKLWVEDDGFIVPPERIANTPRIGIDYAEPKHRNAQWRFVLQ